MPRFVILLLLLFCSFWQAARSQWVKAFGPEYSSCNAFAAVGGFFFSGWSEIGVYRSSDDGVGWIQLNSGLPPGAYGWIGIGAFAVNGTKLFAAENGSVFATTDSGLTWSKVYGDEFSARAWSLAVSGESILMGTYQRGVYRSTDHGASWAQANTGLPAASLVVYCFAVAGTKVFIGTNKGVYRSTDSGSNWTAAAAGLPLDTNRISALCVNGTDLFAGTWGQDARSSTGVFRSTDNGDTWTPVNHGLPSTPSSSSTIFSPYSGIFALVSSDNRIFAGTQVNGIYCSSNAGASWTGVDAGLPPNTSIYALTVFGTSLFAGSYGGIWRRPLAEMVTTVGESSEGIPVGFALLQNYPNPFNPSTTIRYTLPRRSQVTLNVYNTLGQRVATLVNGEVEAGDHDVNFDASGLASGVYFYRLQAGSFTQTKKFCFVR